VRSTGSVAGLSVDATYAGWGAAYELLIGGTLGHGVVLGGGFVGQGISQPNVTLRASSTLYPPDAHITGNGAIGVGAIGPFIDWFPDETGGLHVGGMVGLAILTLQNDNGDQDGGFAGSLWAGYDFWVGREWSLGAEGRGAFVSATRQFQNYDGKTDDGGATYELLFTALYH
jgi:hypothetical protein